MGGFAADIHTLVGMGIVRIRDLTVTVEPIQPVMQEPITLEALGVVLFAVTVALELSLSRLHPEAILKGPATVKTVPLPLCHPSG